MPWLYPGFGTLHGVAITHDGAYLYAPDHTQSGVDGWSVASATGLLTPHAGSPYSLAGQDPHDLVIHPTDAWLYVANYSSHSVSGMAIGAGGALTLIAGSPWTSGAEPHSVCIDRTGQYLYTADFGAYQVSGWAINQMTGALTPIPGLPWSLGTAAPWVIRANPTQDYLYVGTLTGAGTWSFAINTSTGALAVVDAGLGGTGVNTQRGIVVSRDGQTVYMVSAMLTAPHIDVYRVGSGGHLTTVAGSPVATPARCWNGVMSHSNSYLLSADNDDSAIVVCGRASDGIVGQVPLSPFASADEPEEVCVRYDDQYVYVASYDGWVNRSGLIPQGAVMAYRLFSSGVLAPLGWYPHLPGEDWGMVLTPQTSTLVQTAASLREYTLVQAQYPTYQIQIPYDYLTDDDYHQLLGIWLLQKTTGTDIYLRVPGQDTATAVPFGVGDGVTATFRLMRSIGGYSEPVAATLGACSAMSGGVFQVATFPGDGTVTFAAAPASGAWLTWSGMYGFRCQFSNDSDDWNQIVDGIWQTDKVTLQTRLP